MCMVKSIDEQIMFFFFPSLILFFTWICVVCHREHVRIKITITIIKDVL